MLLLLLVNGTIYSAFYAVSATISTLFAVAYPFLSETDIGLCFLAVGGGGTVATVTVGKLLDYQFRALKRKLQREHEDKADAEKGGAGPSEHDEDFPIEKACMQSQHIWIWAFSIACIGYGWAVQAKVNLAVPLLLQFVRKCRPNPLSLSLPNVVAYQLGTLLLAS